VLANVGAMLLEAPLDPTRIHFYIAHMFGTRVSEPADVRQGFSRLCRMLMSSQFNHNIMTEIDRVIVDGLKE